MPLLHDAAFREASKNRLRALRPDATRHWGQMSIDQMLWHVNGGLENALGRFPVAPVRVPLPKSLMKVAVFYLPWGKGKTPTAPELVAKGTHDFEQERDKLFRLIDEFSAKSIEGTWGDSAFLGPMRGRDWSRLMAKHVDHHLRQFGV